MLHYVDLHIHSLHSDGLHAPAFLVEEAAARGLRAMAIADHDSVDGIEEALAAGSRLGIEVVPAVELSVQHAGYSDVHLLGYMIDFTDAAFNAKLRTFRRARDERGKLIIDRINDLLAGQHHPPLSYDKIVESAEGALGRPHIARELVERGLAADMQDAFVRYLIPCDVPKQYFPVEEALHDIRRLGGVSVLAHPVSITNDRSELRSIISDLAALGLQGIEVYNNLCYRDDTDFLAGIAWRMGLASTGGSDYHGGEDALEIGTLRSGLKVPYEAVESLKKKREEVLPRQE